MTSAMRIIEIKQKCTRLDLSSDTPAARYVRSLGVPIDAPLAPNSFFFHPALSNWADHGRPAPALCALTWCGSAYLALHAIFLTEDGALSPSPDPRLRMGILEGTCVEISNEGDPDELWISRSVETGLRAAFAQGKPRNVVAALLASHIPDLDRLRRPGAAARRIVIACDGLNETARKAEERERAIAALVEQGFDVRLQIITPTAAPTHLTRLFACAPIEEVSEL